SFFYFALSFFFFLSRRSPCSTLFPYTTLFRSLGPCVRAARSSARAPGTEQEDLRESAEVAAGPRLSARVDQVPEHPPGAGLRSRSEEHTSELQSLAYLVCRLLLEKKKINNTTK